MTRIFLLSLSLLFCASLWAQKSIKVSCIGNSITHGVGTVNKETDSYPARLQQMLGEKYKVGNFGKSGATLLNKGHRPYMKQPEFKKAMDFAGDIAIIHLGINDTDPRNWHNHRDSFVKDYLSLIDSCKKVNPKCRVIIARITPITSLHRRFESGTRDWHAEIQCAIEQVARLANVQLTDFHEPLFRYPFLLPDALHPNNEGAIALAQTVYSAITGEYGGLKLSDLYADNMVLQRDIPLEIHGKANAGDKVSVSIARQKLTTRTSDNGRWSVRLAAMQAGGPHTLSISAGNQTLTYKNVLVGEVWLCSGQSNMEFMLKQAATAKADIPQANDNELRLFDLKARWLTNSVEWSESALDSVNHLQYYKPTGWTSCTPATAASFSAVAYYFGKMLRDSLNVPVGLICNAIGGSPTETWVDRRTLEVEFPAILRDWTKNDFIQDWVRGRAALNIKKSADKLQRHPYEPCYLFEAGIRPLDKYPVKGVVWYQGESNAHNKEAHEKLFKLLVNSWRSNWEKPNMPFYYVQLSGIDRPSWPWFRDSQRRLMESVPNTAMVVSSDQGDSLDVHPTNKKPIGERLARWALHRTYGRGHVLPSGPLFRNAEFRNGAAYVSFDYDEGMHSVDGTPLRTFEVAEEEGLYEPAIAEVEGNRLKVYSAKIQHPRFVRYGWQPFTRANLVNAAGLPASTFRAAAPAALVTIDRIAQMHGFPQKDKNFAKGVSACFAGVAEGKLLIAGGCNFPKIPACDGGAKKYYRDIYAAELPTDSVLAWHKVGQLPQATAYGVSVSTSDGMICVGGMNERGALSATYRIRMVNGKVVVETLPSLPCTLDNMTGSLWGQTLYVAGGNKDGKASNAFYSLNMEQLSQGWQELPAFPGSPRVQPVSAVQLDADGQACFYLWGGFAASSEGRPASLSVDGYVYSPLINQWTALPEAVNEAGEAVSLGGGVATAWGENLILCMGGVDKDIFLRALQKPEPDYLTHPVEWYRFNKHILAYDVCRKKWQTVAYTPDTARAGAALVVCGQTVFYINGELKPGIRTPGITCLTIKE